MAFFVFAVCCPSVEKRDYIMRNNTRKILAMLPVFVLISITQWLFSVKFQGVLPVNGWGTFKHMILPIAIGAFGSVATYARYVKASMLDTLDQDYVLTAKAKGLSQFQIITRHVLRNSLMPAVTIFAGSVVGVFTGCPHNWGKEKCCACGSYGNYVWLDHGNGKETIYGHLTSAGVQPGDTVKKGQVIGLVGSTGNSTGPHLHFECRMNGDKYDPMTEF